MNGNRWRESRRRATRSAPSSVGSATSDATTSGNAVASPDTTPAAPRASALAASGSSRRRRRAFDQVGLDAVERRVGDLEAGEVGDLVAESLHDRQGDGVTAARGDLVQEERRRRARGRDGREVARELLLVERVVRRGDGGDRIHSGAGRVLGEGDAVGGRLRAAVDDDGKPPRARLDEEVCGAPSFLERQEQALAGRPQREDAVEPVVGEELHEGREAVLVELRSPVSEGVAAAARAPFSTREP